MPSHDKLFKISSSYSCFERSRSVSSRRSINMPPVWRANSQLYSAVRAEPRCRYPVGLGAMRVLIIFAPYPNGCRGFEKYCGDSLGSVNVCKFFGSSSETRRNLLVRKNGFDGERQNLTGLYYIGSSFAEKFSLLEHYSTSPLLVGSGIRDLMSIGNGDEDAGASPCGYLKNTTSGTRDDDMGKRIGGGEILFVEKGNNKSVVHIDVLEVFNI